MPSDIQDDAVAYRRLGQVPDYARFGRRPEDLPAEDFMPYRESEHAFPSDGGQGSSGSSGSGGSSGGSGGGSGGGGNAAYQADSRTSSSGDENPRYTGRGDRRAFQSQRRQSRSSESSSSEEGSDPSQSGGQPMGHQHTPAVVVAGGIPSPYQYGFGYPYGGYPVAAAPVAAAPYPASGAPVTTVVTDGGNGSHCAKDALLGIAVDGIRESAASQRDTMQGQHSLHQSILSLALGGKDTVIANLHQAADAERRISHEVSDVRKEVALNRDAFREALACHTAELSRVRESLREETLRVLENQTQSRIRDLETRLADAREARRDDRMIDLLKDIRDKLSTSP